MFNPEQAKAIQEEKSKGEPRRLRRCGCEVLFAPAGNREARGLIRQKERQYRAKNGLLGRNAEKPIPDEARESIFEEVISEAMVKGWSDVVDGEGKPIEFSPAMFLRFMREIDAFRMDVLEIVGQDEDDLAEEREAISGNS